MSKRSVSPFNLLLSPMILSYNHKNYVLFKSMQEKEKIEIPVTPHNYHNTIKLHQYLFK